MDPKGGKKKEGRKSDKTFADEAGQHFLLPTDLSLLHKKEAGESWHQRITRWINAFVELNTDKGALITPALCVNAFTFNKGKDKKSKTQMHRIKKLEKAGKLNMMVGLALEAVHGPGAIAAGTSQDPISVDDDDEGEDEDEEEEDTGSGNEETDGTTRQSTSVPSGAASTQGDSRQQESAPTASDWASLLGPEAESAPGLASTQSKGKSKSTQHGQPEVAGFRKVMSEGDAEMERQRYFPGATEICTVCAATGHRSSVCPDTLCQFCRGDHFSWNCPGRSRCAKCRQFGHTKSACKEKLAMALEEGLECAFCGEGDHLENACDNVWHSYHLREDDTHTVRYIAAFCSYCGCEGHYSSDCPAGDKQPFPQKWTATWSLRDRDLCVDANATDESIARFGVATASNDPSMHIRGAAVAAKRTHIFYSDSDGSEEGEFLGDKVKPRAAPGQMRMSTNIQFNSMPSTAFAGQPPLPPGPPPSGPPPGNPGSYSRMASSYGAPSHSLPPRPPAPGQPPSGPGGQRGGYHNVPPPKGPATQPKNKAKGKNVPQSNKKRAAAQQGSSQQNSSRPNSRKGNNNNKKPRRGGKQG
ncbi:hypothetical protein ACHAQH_003464 [Verticillium albo-atrum]